MKGGRQLKFAIFADSEQRDVLRQQLPRVRPTDAGIFYRSYDDFLSGLPDCSCDAVLVAQAGALGMESVRAARILLPTTPLIWLSDDRGFGPESYRAGCSYFSADPITHELLEQALKQCQL